MKKKILKRILALIIVFLMIISTPFYISENINNNPYVYAATTFTQDLESKLFLQTLIPTLISAGLVFNTKESIEKAAEDTIEWLKQQGFDWKPPNEPDGPNLGDVVKEMLKAITLVSASYELGKGIVEIPKMLWNLIKSFVDDNYDEGENIIESDNENIIKNNNRVYTRYTVGLNTIYLVTDKKINILVERVGYNSTYDRIRFHYPKEDGTTYSSYFNIPKSEIDHSGYIGSYINGNIIVGRVLNDDQSIENWTIDPDKSYSLNSPLLESLEYEFIYGTPDIIDNPNYDWNNNYTDSKVIPIPIETDAYGNLKKDENEYYLPATETEDWIGVTPIEIPNLDPSGTPIPDIPPFPDIENPDDDEQTGIMIYIGNVLQIIVGQLSKIVEGVNTIVSNTNQLVFNTPNPIFDPITGEQINPETGEPIVQPDPEASTGDGIIGNGIDTSVPTDFEWGDFRHFLDIFFIFIYFIVILILIILKFLQIVFVGIPNIASNTDLFTQYPNILEGVNYVKNLQVGGLTITVHQAFEFVFLIFFYIFIIKQIRKLYNAHVFEESAENPKIAQDMKMDYYENRKFNRWSDDK